MVDKYRKRAVSKPAKPVTRPEEWPWLVLRAAARAAARRAAGLIDARARGGRQGIGGAISDALSPRPSAPRCLYHREIRQGGV